MQVVEHVPGIEAARRPAQQVEADVELRRQHLAEVFRLRLGVQVHLDADLGEHADHRQADRLVVDVAVVRAIHADLEAVRIAGLGQQLLRLVRVQREALEVRAGAVDRLRDHHRRRRRQAAHHLLLDRLDVDRPEERLAHPYVLKRVLALDVGVQQLFAELVHAEEDGTQLRPDQHPAVGVAVDPLHVLYRDRIGHVDLAGQQRGDPGRIGRDRGKDHLRQVVLLVGVVPPVRVDLGDGLDPGFTADQDERASAVGMPGGVVLFGARRRLRLDRVVLFGPGLGHDGPAGPLEMDDRIRRRGDEIDGVVVNLDHLGVLGDPALQVGAVGPHPRGREHHVVRRERPAVVELDALAEVEPPSRRLQDLPALRQGRFDRQPRAAASQALVDVAEVAQGEGLIQVVGVHRIDSPLKGEFQALRLSRQRDCHGQRPGQQ